MPPYQLLFGVVAPIVAVAVAVNDHVNVNGRTARAEDPFEPKGNAGAFGASAGVGQCSIDLDSPRGRASQWRPRPRAAAFMQVLVLMLRSVWGCLCRVLL